MGCIVSHSWSRKRSDDEVGTIPNVTVPPTIGVSELSGVIATSMLASPGSAIFSLPSTHRMFSGLISPWQLA